MAKFSKELLAEIKEVIDPDKVLSIIGFEPKTRSSKEVRGVCPIHKGDNKTAFRFVFDTKTFNCFSHGCHELGSDIFALIQASLGMSFMESVKFLADLAGIDLETYEIDPEVVEERERKKFLSKEEKIRLYKTLSPEIPEDLIKIYILNRNGYFSSRGFPLEILDYFEVGSARDDYGIERATIPVRDDECRLIGVTGRRVDSDDDPKYLPVGRPFDKGKVIYNLCSAKEHIMSSLSRPVIIVEGFTDVWNMVRHGFLNTVSSMGVEVLEPQAYLLSKYCLTVYLMMDPDEAGRKGTLRSEKLLKNGFKVRKISIPDKKDPGDMTAEEIRSALIEGGYYR